MVRTPSPHSTVAESDRLFLTARVSAFFLLFPLFLLIPAASFAQLPVDTTLEDFFLPGTQPDPTGDNVEPIVGAMEGNCTNCHADFEISEILAEPFRHWVGSMMAQAMRDPLFLASLTVANQDASFSGDLCLRCHTPAGWLGGRSTPTDGSALQEPADFEGVTCHFCHRLVDPVYEPGTSPAEDETIVDSLSALGLLPFDFGSGKYVVDPEADVRRGPRDGINHPQGSTAIFSPFHSESAICGTCHDVSNPALSRQPDGSYVPNALGAAHPTLDEHDMFPVERTFSEWSHSDFANGGVQMNGRFGGNHATGVMGSCQDCHMPDQVGPGCRNSGTVRPDAPQHALNGGNTWVLDAVRNLVPDAETGLTDEFAQDAAARVATLLENASDMELAEEAGQLRVRVTNFSGHKLPTGYPEGRRMWVQVAFFDAANQLLQEHGSYDQTTATLTTSDTKVYEAKLGLDATMAQVTGLPEGESFHFVLNNEWLKDNRIPPMGFTNAAFAAVGAAPVAYSYADGQHWDDTLYPIPASASRAEARLYYQTNSKEYAEFLLGENVTDDRGQTFYDQWDLLGRSTPALMDEATIAFADGTQFVRSDCNGDGHTDLSDPLRILGVLFGSDPPLSCADACDADDGGTLGLADAIVMLDYVFGSGPPFAAPFPACGEDPTEDGLDCAEFSLCL